MPGAAFKSDSSSCMQQLFCELTEHCHRVVPGELHEEGGHATRVPGTKPVICTVYSTRVPARHPEAGPGHVHRLAGHGHPGVTRLRHEARVADGDLGPEPRVPDLQISYT